MSDSDVTPVEDTPAATPKPPPKPALPSRELPDIEAIGRWIEGEELPLLGALFELPSGAPLPLAKFDALGMQLRKAEILAEHWQVIADHSVPPDSVFDSLSETARLRAAYDDSELAARRLDNLRLAWRELAGKQPSLWRVPDVLAAMRRLLDRKVDFDAYALLSAVRDVWRGMTLPFGREQLEILWASLAFIRGKTKK